MRNTPLLLAAAFAFSGCAPLADVYRPPALSPVGSGLRPPVIPIEADPGERLRYGAGNSLWQDASSDLYRDPRASRVGDVITVKIDIKDRAIFDAKNERKREQKGELDVNFEYDLNLSANGQQGPMASGSGSVNPQVNSTTDTKTEGKVNRAENIRVLVAAVVIDVLPNGYLMISGTQEIQVNYELRQLGVAGVVRPRDIATDNSISYDKIAEARITYGGRGRIMEVSQPAWGQQILDIISPF
jgi:flagellar L-ring protein precursor FlgH